MLTKFISLVMACAFPSLSSAYSIDKKQISVSGLSSGSYMAGQLHVAHSELFMGAALIAGGPYYCSQGSLSTAMFSCMDITMGAPKLKDLTVMTHGLAKLGQIDSVENLASSRVFVLGGKNDKVVSHTVNAMAADFYKSFGVSSEQIKIVDNLPMGHTFPTDNFGNACEAEREPPFISNCNYDAAGALLTHMYGPLKSKTMALKDNFYEFSQLRYFKGYAEDISLSETGVAYVPTACQNDTKCKIHVAIHGCRQTRDDIKELFYTKTGYNEWAEANNIIVIYPQAVHSDSLGNPLGCWDWWGYTGSNFHTKEGVQIQMVTNLVNDFMDPKMKLKKKIFNKRM